MYRFVIGMGKALKGTQSLFSTADLHQAIIKTGVFREDDFEICEISTSVLLNFTGANKTAAARARHMARHYEGMASLYLGIAIERSVGIDVEYAVAINNDGEEGALYWESPTTAQVSKKAQGTATMTTKSNLLVQLPACLTFMVPPMIIG